MHILRPLLLAATLLLAGLSHGLAQGTPASSPSTETLAAAKALVALMSRATITQMTESVTAKVWPQIEAAVRARYPKIDAPTLGEMHEAYVHLVADTVGAAMTDTPAIYAHYFTAGEMNEIVAFYRTPTGAKALTVMPKVMGDFLPALMPRMQAMKGQLVAAFDDILKKHGFETK